MAGKSPYDWPRLFLKAQELVRAGKVVPPEWTVLANLLELPRNTLSSNFKSRFGVLKIAEIVKMDLPIQEDAYQGIMPAQVIRLLKTEPMTLAELSDALDRGQSAVDAAVRTMIADGFGILRAENKLSIPVYMPADPLPTLYDQPRRRIIFGVMSDLHIGSKAAQISALKRFIQVGVDEYQVENFLITGDLTAGNGVYRGQVNDLYAVSADDQVDSLCHTLPEISGVRYIMIGGNHDYSFMRQNGLNVIRMAAMVRPDFTNAGFDQAEVPLFALNGQVTASAILWHPSGGVPYALSYRGQKMAAEIGRRELTSVVLDRKPAPTVRFVFWGHLHVSDFFPHGPIWVMGPGCFEGSNSYLKAKGLEPVIQGLIVEADLTDGGLISGVHVHAIPFVEAEADYRCGWVPELERETEKIVPVFSATETKSA